jgi:hypothetical protein
MASSGLRADVVTRMQRSGAIIKTARLRKFASGSEFEMLGLAISRRELQTSFRRNG